MSQLKITRLYDNFLSGLNAAKPEKYTPVDVSNYYNNAANQYAAAMESAYQKQVEQSNKRAEQIAQEYEDKRRQTYVNARLDAVGNNEKAAALGLAGNVYQEPRSGYSETSRIAETVALRNDLNSANRAEQNAKDQLALQLMEAGYTKDIELAQWMADLAIKQAEAEQEEAHFAYGADLDYFDSSRDYLAEALEAALQKQKTATAISSKKRSSSSTGSGNSSGYLKVNGADSKKKSTAGAAKKSKE